MMNNYKNQTKFDINDIINLNNFAIKYNYQKLCRIDSDGEHNPIYINDIFSKLNNKDFVIGQRNISHKERIFKTFSKKILILMINKLFNLNFSDYNFKL